MPEINSPYDNHRAEEILRGRIEDLDKMENNTKRVEKLARREKRWRRAKLGLFMAPVVAAGAFYNTPKGEKWDTYTRVAGDFYALLGAGALYGAGGVMQGRQKIKAERISKDSVEIAERLRMPLPRPMQQTLESKQLGKIEV